MGAPGFVWALLASTPLLFGQGVYEMTITESRTINVQPDQAGFTIAVDAPLSYGLDAVLATLTDLGVTAENLIGVSGPGTLQMGKSTEQVLVWNFSLSVPLGKTKDTIASLNALEARIARQYNGMSLTFYGGSTQVSSQALAAQTCPVAELVADARTKASTLASANGFTLGPIVAMTDGSSVPAAIPGQPNARSLSGYLLPATSLSGFLLFVAPINPTPPCVVTVKFNMFRD